MSQNGKGDGPRPRFISREFYESEWERIFRRTKDKATKCEACRGTGRTRWPAPGKCLYCNGTGLYNETNTRKENE